MTERIISKSGVSMKGVVLGYEQGYQLRVAMLAVDGKKVLGCEFCKFWSPHEAVARFVDEPRPLGIGLRVTLAVGTGREGWRPADYWIDESPFNDRDPDDEFPFYWGPFQTGSSLEGIALLMAMRRQWPGLPATQTQPTECFRHLNRSPKLPALQERVATLAQWLNVDLPADLDEESWRAAMSSFAMWQGLRGEWPIDLFQMARPASKRRHWSSEDGEQAYQQPAMSYDTLLFPAGPVASYWPPDERGDEA
jgi:hypothetical protein